MRSKESGRKIIVEDGSQEMEGAGVEEGTGENDAGRGHSRGRGKVRYRGPGIIRGCAKHYVVDITLHDNIFPCNE